MTHKKLPMRSAKKAKKPARSRRVPKSYEAPSVLKARFQEESRREIGRAGMGDPVSQAYRDGE